jgi:hypothetical protein
LKTNTLSKLAGGAAVLALAATLTACGGGSASGGGSNEDACSSVKDAITGYQSSLSEVSTDPTKAGETFVGLAKEIQEAADKNSGASVSADLKTLANAFTSLGEAVSKASSDPTGAMEGLKAVQSDDFTKAMENITTTCKFS